MIFSKDYFYLFLVNIVLTVFYFSVHRLIAKKINLFDVPNHRKNHKGNVPITGGIGFALVLLVNGFFLNEINSLFFYVLIFAVGIADDKFNLSPYLRIFLITIILFFFFYFNSSYQIQFIEIKKINFLINLGKYSIFFSIFVFIYVLQAFNLFDGVNLQTTLFSISVFGYLFFLSQNIIFLLIILYLVIFLYFNYKTYSFLGDGGCHIIAFVICVYFSKLYNLREISLVEVCILLSLPCFDLFRIFFLRISEGNSPFLADNNHFHHIVVKKFSFKILMFFLCLYFFAEIFLLIYFPNFISFVFLFLIYIFCIFLSKGNRSIK